LSACEIRLDLKKATLNSSFPNELPSKSPIFSPSQNMSSPSRVQTEDRTDSSFFNFVSSKIFEEIKDFSSSLKQIQCDLGNLCPEMQWRISICQLKCPFLFDILFNSLLNDEWKRNYNSFQLIEKKFHSISIMKNSFGYFPQTPQFREICWLSGLFGPEVLSKPFDFVFRLVSEMEIRISIDRKRLLYQIYSFKIFTLRIIEILIYGGNGYIILPESKDLGVQLLLNSTKKATIQLLHQRKLCCSYEHSCLLLSQRITSMIKTIFNNLNLLSQDINELILFEVDNLNINNWLRKFRSNKSLHKRLLRLLLSLKLLHRDLPF
jgi:hypothetical protein